MNNDDDILLVCGEYESKINNSEHEAVVRQSSQDLDEKVIKSTRSRIRIRCKAGYISGDVIKGKTDVYKKLREC